MFETYDRITGLFLKNCRRNCLAENSIQTYTRTFRYLREFAERDGFTDVDSRTVAAWKLSLDVSLNTLDQYLRSIQRLSEFAESCGEIDAPLVRPEILPPAKKVAQARHKEYAHILDRDAAVALMGADRAVYGRTPHTFLREKAAVTLLLTSGLRNTELRNLTPADLDWEHGKLQARVTKGDKPRSAPFSAEAMRAVAAYLKSGLRPADAADEDFLLGTVGKDGKWHGLGNQQLSALVFNYTKSIIGEDAACRTHALRHCMASAALESGHAMDEIATVLGHSNIATTQIYAKRLNPDAAIRSFGNLYGQPA